MLYLRNQITLAAGVVALVGAFILAAMHPSSAQQTGGLPALERRVAALEALVKSLQQTNTDQSNRIAALEKRLDQAETKLAALDAGLMGVQAKTAPISVAGNDFIVSGKNVFIQDGSGVTHSDTGLGNLTVGYNALRTGYWDVGNERTGTHNLILGDKNNYTSYGGLVAGYGNAIQAQGATVTGGAFNTANGQSSSVNGGNSNTASGFCSSVTGGAINTASNQFTSVTGGQYNTASGYASSVSGGWAVTANGGYIWQNGAWDGLGPAWAAAGFNGH
jgi:hypothetical protein